MFLIKCNYISKITVKNIHKTFVLTNKYLFITNINLGKEG